MKEDMITMAGMYREIVRQNTQLIYSVTNYMYKTGVRGIDLRKLIEIIEYMESKLNGGNKQ